MRHLQQLRLREPARLPQPREGGEGVARAQKPVAPAMLELEQLNGEFDVAQPAGADLDVGRGLAGRFGLLFDLSLVRADIFRELGGELAAEDVGLDHRFEGLAQLQAAGNMPGLQ